MSSDAPSSSPAPPPVLPWRSLSGRQVVIVGSLVSFVVLLFSAWFGPRISGRFLEDRPQRLAEYHRRLAEGLQAYYADHGAFPPEEPWFRHLISQKNFRSFAKPIFPQGQFPPQALYTPYFFPTMHRSMLTTPVAYLPRRMPGDPFLLPEPVAPALYVNNGSYVVLWSPGPDLEVNTKADRFRGLPIEEARALVNLLTYDPTNGAGDARRRGISLSRPPRGSAGDIFMIVEPAG